MGMRYGSAHAACKRMCVPGSARLSLHVASSTLHNAHVHGELVHGRQREFLNLFLL